MSAGDYLVRLAVALPLVLALAVAAIVALKRGWLRLPARIEPSARLRAVASLPLAPGVRLVAVEFDGRPLLLAVGRGSITPLPVAP